MNRSNSFGGDVLAVAIVCLLLMFVGGFAAVGTLFWWGPSKAERMRARDNDSPYRYGEKDYYKDYAPKDGYDYGPGNGKYDYDEKMSTESYPDDSYPKSYDKPFDSKDGYKDF